MFAIPENWPRLEPPEREVMARWFALLAAEIVETRKVNLVLLDEQEARDEAARLHDEAEARIVAQRAEDARWHARETEDAAYVEWRAGRASA